MAGLGVVI